MKASRHDEHNSLSREAAENLAARFSSENLWEKIARSRYLSFLEREGLQEQDSDQEPDGLIPEWRKNLFGLAWACACASLVFLSLHCMFGSETQEPRLEPSQSSITFNVSLASKPANVSPSVALLFVPKP